MKNMMKKILSLLLVVVMFLGGVCIPDAINLNTVNAAETESFAVGDVIEFGSYPQTRVTDGDLITELNSINATWRSYGYMSGSGTGWCDGSANASDYMQYKDVTYKNERYRAVLFTTYRSGFVTYKSTETCYNYQQTNGYTINNIYWFKFEPLEWKVLDPNNGLVICNSIIDSQAFNNNLYSTGNTTSWSARYWKDSARTILANNYANSNIKEWLNDDFYYTAFTEDNRKIINANTNGKIFLLTKSDTQNASYGFSSDSARKAYGTDYAKVQGLRVSNGTSIWMTQSAASSLGINISCVHFDGHVFDRESNDYGHTQMTFQGVRPAMCIELGVLTNSVFPAGYDYNQDRWIFQNPLDTVSKEIYIEAFGNMKGTVLAGLKESKSHGLCYGLSATMATILNHNSILTSFERQNRYASKMADIERYALLSEYNSAQYGMELEKFIKIAFVSQYDSTVSEELNGNKNKLKELCAAVKKYVQGDGAALHIVLTKSDGSQHSISPLGIVETDENIVMYVLDTNYNHAEVTDNRIIIDKSYNSWRYTTNDYSYSSSAGSSISYNYPSSLMYNVLQIYQNNQNKSNVKMLTSDKKLIVANKKMESNDDLIDINYFVADSNSDNIQNNYAYWYNKDDATIILTPDESTAITVVGQYSSITATVPENTDASFIIEDGTEDQFSCDYKKNSDINVAFAFANEHGEISAISIFGIAIGDTITATQTETGLLVTGIADGTVTLSKDDEVIATQTFSDAISDIEITYDKTGEVENLQLDYEQPEEPTDPEVPTEPDVPTEPTEPEDPETPAEPSDDTTDCSCLCHSKDSFLQFIYTILRFLWQLFGMNMDCACGAKHFDSYFFG